MISPCSDPRSNVALGELAEVIESVGVTTERRAAKEVSTAEETTVCVAGNDFPVQVVNSL